MGRQERGPLSADRDDTEGGSISQHFRRTWTRQVELRLHDTVRLIRAV